MHSRKPCMGLSGAFSVIEEEDRVEWKDGKCRCCWANPKNERYIRYHDEEAMKQYMEDEKIFQEVFQEMMRNGDARFMMTESCLKCWCWSVFRQGFPGNVF